MQVVAWLKDQWNSAWILAIMRWARYFLLAVVAGALIYGGYYLFFKSDDLPAPKGLAEFYRSSYIYAVDNKITWQFFYQNRDPVKFKDLPESVKKSILAAEDKYFFYHPGVNPLAILRAALQNYILHHRVVSGASTITQQLIRLLYEEEVPEFKRRDLTPGRKIKEARLALRLERQFSKEEILEAYLNYVYFGHGRYGIVEAARFYFSKELKELTIPEAAMLAALSKYPARYCPIHAQKRALGRRNWILNMMKDAWFISSADLEKYLKEPIKLDLSKTDYRFGYAMDFVRRRLLAQNYKPQDIWHNGGLRVKTTIDPAIQRTVDRVLKDHLKVLNKQQGLSPALEGAVIVIENGTGKIAALSGGHDFLETQYNRAVQRSARRQPGSAFKIFTYTEALIQGKTFHDKICDCPLRLPGKINFYGKVLQWWTPQNYREKSHPPFMGMIDLFQGLVLSRNVGTLQLARSLGLKKVLSLAQRMGIKSPLSPYLPTVIGASDVGLLELTAAYTVFPGGGVYRDPYIVEEISDSGSRILYRHASKKEQVIPESVAEDMTVMLRAVTEVGTAKMTFRGIGQKVAGKTGTTNDSRDVLFFGFTPGPNGYTVGVRLGYDVPRSLGEKQTGGLLAAPICRDIIEKIYQDHAQQSFSAAVEEKLAKLLHTPR